MNGSDAVLATISSVAEFKQIDYAIIILLLLISLAIGVLIAFGRSFEQTNDDFLFASFKTSCIPVALSLLLSQLSPIVILTMPVEIYLYGWQYTMFIPVLILTMLALCYIFLPILYQNKFDNCYTYVGVRFRPLSRHINIGVFIINNIFYLPVILYIPSLAIAELTQIEVHIVNAVVCYICVTQLWLGGLRAIISIGVIHALILVSTLVMIAACGIHHVGVEEIWDRAIAGGRIEPPDLSLNLTTRTTLWNLAMSTFLVWSAHVSFSQNNIQRIVSLPTLETARRTVVILFMAVMVILFINCGIGLIMYAHYYDCDPVKAHLLPNYDKLLPYFTQSIAGHIDGMPGLFVAALLCGSLSVVAPTLHSLSGIIYKDLIRPWNLFIDNVANATFTMRIIIFAIGTYCAMSSFLVEAFYSTFQLLNAITVMSTGAKVGVFTLAFFWPWTNINGLLSGTVLSMCVVCALIINAQYHMMTGDLKHATMPTSIEGCAASDNFTLVSPSPETVLFTEADEEFDIHDISFHWYTLVGVICSWIPCVTISYLTGGRDLSTFNFQLVSPLVHRFVPKKYLHQKLRVISIISDDDRNNRFSDVK